ncbi:MAG TPA: EamA family transporter RarD [Gammaproteobacteria bacterium]|nr:EamA family transporter RarD [Arenicellales bacterium]MDP7064437.1 EamA family transporter RarD [Arenicellales bacterium]HCX88575.1 EamA family transporter RarD [Gammaproteobacteria bacterium]
MQPVTSRHVDGAGLAYGLCAIVIWGSFPLYFKQTESFGFLSVYGHRALWAMPFMFLVLLGLRSWQEVVPVFRSRRLLLPIMATSLIIAVQQALYIWGVFTERIVELSMGFYLVPAFSIFFGYLFFQERIGRTQWLAVGLSISGVAALIVMLGENPWLGVTMGLTFTVYSGIRKRLSVDPAAGLFLETVPLFFIGLWFVIQFPLQDDRSLLSWPELLLPLSAVYTILPILLYVIAARRIALSLLGTLFYLAPTGNFFFGVLVYNETFSQIHVVAFLLIWFGLGIYLYAERAKVE